MPTRATPCHYPAYQRRSAVHGMNNQQLDLHQQFLMFFGKDRSIVRQIVAGNIGFKYCTNLTFNKEECHE
jgi:hypothetical protein